MANTAIARGKFLARISTRRAMAPTSEINVIPFIDVLLVMLIIFMVTAPKPTRDIPVDLPQAGPVVQYDVTPVYIVLRDGADGVDAYVDGERAALDQLVAITRAHIESNNPDLPLAEVFTQGRVMVRPEQGMAYGNVVAAMDELKRGGFAKVGVFAELAQET